MNDLRLRGLVVAGTGAAIAASQAAITSARCSVTGKAVATMTTLIQMVPLIGIIAAHFR